MVNIPTWKIILICLVSFLGFLYSAPNLLAPATVQSLQDRIPSWLPTKTINLGLDLRGGAHLLYEVDVDVVFKERAESILQDLRQSLRENQISYSRLAEIEKGVRLSLRNPEDGERVRRMIRTQNTNLEITSGTNDQTIEAVLTEEAIRQITDQTLSQSIEIVRRRVDETGTTEPTIIRQGERRILLQVPGANAEDLKRVVGKTAKLTFHLLQDPGRRAVGALEYPLSENPAQTLTLQRRAVITGDMLSNAQPSFQEGQPVVSFSFNNLGARRFCDVTRQNVGKPFAIVLDELVISAPVIRDAICGGAGIISGGFTVQEVNDLALLLRAGALPAPLAVVEERSVGPSLGADSVEAGKNASMAGLALVLTFMVVAYGLFGFFAAIALVVNVALIFALLSGLQATLTLPGIAGIVLTVGMAVDANVLIFERIKEEVRSGRSVISAIDAGYSRAMATIIDSNLTTLIAALILFSFGTGPIKGFAVTLGIGIMTSFFSAIMVTRLMVVLWMRKTKPNAVPL